MTFLSKLGTYLARGVAVLTGLEPLISPLFGSKAATVAATAANDLTSIGQVVVQAEALIQGTGLGASKLSAVAPLVANILKTSELVSGHQISNLDLFMKASTGIASAVADLMNSLSPDGVKSQGQPLPQKGA